VGGLVQDGAADGGGEVSSVRLWAEVPESERLSPDVIAARMVGKWERRYGHGYLRQCEPRVGGCAAAVRADWQYFSGRWRPCRQLATGAADGFPAGLCHLHGGPRTVNVSPPPAGPSGLHSLERLSVRVYNILRSAGYTTAREVARLSDDELLGLRNLGYLALEEIRAVIGRDEAQPDQPPGWTVIA
jgi:hypothetical protein